MTAGVSVFEDMAVIGINIDNGIGLKIKQRFEDTADIVPIDKALAMKIIN